MSARDRLAELAADETASVYAAPRGLPPSARPLSEVELVARDVEDRLQADARREALASALADVPMDRYGEVVALRGGAA